MASTPFLLLEDWLQRSVSLPSPATSSAPHRPSPPAHQISQSWSQLLLPSLPRSFPPASLHALSFLRTHAPALHISLPQARSLLAILSSCAQQHSGDENIVALACSHSALLLSVWLRRTYAPFRGFDSPDMLGAILRVLKSMEASSRMRLFASEAILLLGSVCVSPQSKDELRRDCRDVIARLCTMHHTVIRENGLNIALAGMAYAMVASSGPSLAELLKACFLLWETDFELMIDKDVSKSPIEAPRLSDGLLLLHMMEWCGHTFTSMPLNPSPLHTLAVEIIEAGRRSPKRSSIKCAVIMSAAGLLRCFHQSKRPLSKRVESVHATLVPTLESCIKRFVDDTFTPQMQRDLNEKLVIFPLNEIQAEKLVLTDLTDRYSLQFATLAVTRCTRFAPSVSVLLCLVSTLLRDAFPLSDYYSGNMTQTLENPRRGIFEHVEGILFSEAGSVFRIICEQYLSADEEWQICIEKYFLGYAHFVYRSHRYFLSSIKISVNSSGSQAISNIENDNQALRKIHEAILLSVVLILSYATKRKVHADTRIKGTFAADVLSSLGCIDFIRQAQIPEYSDVVQKCVAWVSATEETSAMLTSMIPSYSDAVSPPGPSLTSYKWTEDAIQDARMLFGFRVLPSCLNTFPALKFLKDIAPLIFLYIKHPNQTIAQASHTLFGSFLSLNIGDDFLEGEKNSIKEQLAVQFIDRSFEEFPVISHYDAFVSGVGAIARHLPPGSSTTMVCVTKIANRASEVFKLVKNKGSDKNEENVLQMGQKLQTLILHLILIVDIQVLPHILQEVAKFVLELHDPQRMKALEEAFDTLAGSDDLTRKHILVPWLQSLSYLCLNPDIQDRSYMKSSRGRKQKQDSIGISPRDGAIAFSPSSSVGVIHTVTEASRSRL